MDASSIDITELESTREDDQQWLNLKEESIIFNESFVSSKFNDLEEDLKETPEVQIGQEPIIDKASKREDIKDVELAHKLIGLVEVEESSFKKMQFSNGRNFSLMHPFHQEIAALHF